MSNKRSVISTLNRLTDKWGIIDVRMSAEGVVEIIGYDPHNPEGEQPTVLSRSFTGLVDAVKDAGQWQRPVVVAVDQIAEIEKCQSV
mgnify:CR=1 FL=1